MSIILRKQANKQKLEDNVTTAGTDLKRESSLENKQKLEDNVNTDDIT